jgi:glutamyl-tRNA synthetase
VISEAGDARSAARCALFKDRCNTLVELADWLAMYHLPARLSDADRSAYLTDAVKPAMSALRGRLAAVSWDKTAIAQAMKDTLAEHRLKMPQLAPPVRVAVCGRSQTPSIDAVLALFDRQTVLERLAAAVD